MSNITIGLICCVFMLILLFEGVPLAYTFALSGVVGIIWILGFKGGVTYLTTVPFTAAASYTFVVMPMFMLMGELCFAGGLTTDAYAAARKWCGHLPGGLAITSTVASGIFGAICGSGATTAMVMTQVAWPEMKATGYNPRIGLSSIAAAGPLAILIPPSTPLIMYGVLSETSIGKLFMAGWLPGILLVVVLSITTVILVKIHPSYTPVVEKASMKERLKSLRHALPVLLLIIIVMGGIWGGICTVNEGAGLGVIGALAIAVCSRRMDFNGFKHCLVNTVSDGASMFFMFVGIQFYTSFMTLSGLPRALASWVSTLDVPPMVIIWGIIILYLILGCFLDSPPVVMLTVGILAPIVEELGFNLIWFGIVVAFTCAMGAITPPVGINLFVIKARAPEVPTSEVIMGVLPYMVAILLTLVVIVYVPQISLLLPNAMYG